MIRGPHSGAYEEFCLLVWPLHIQGRIITIQESIMEADDKRRNFLRFTQRYIAENGTFKYLLISARSCLLAHISAVIVEWLEMV
jgi:hypothetical protein